MAVLEMTDKISAAMEIINFLLEYVDLSKTFDTLDHNILLNKLNYYGIRGNAYNWFKSDLCNRCHWYIVQKRAIRIVCDLPRRAHTASYLK